MSDKPTSGSAGTPKKGASKSGGSKTKGGKSSKSAGAARSTKPGASFARRRGVRQILAADRQPWHERILTSPNALTLITIALGFVLVTASIAFVFRGSLLPAPGRTSTESRTARVDFSIEDPKATDREREIARQTAPPVYALDRATVEAIERSLLSLPEALAATETFDDVAPELTDGFGLTPQAYTAIKQEGGSADTSRRWATFIGRAMDELERTPLLANQAYQRVINGRYNQLVLVEPPAEEGAEPLVREVRKDEALPITEERTVVRERVRDALTGIANRAGLYGERADVFVERVLREGQPVYRIDDESTRERVNAAVNAVKPVLRDYAEGEVLYQAGERIEQAEYAVAREEVRTYRDERSVFGAGVMWFGLAGVVAIVGAAIGGYLWFFYRQLLLHPWRLGALAVMLSGATLLSAWLATTAPGLRWGAVLTPTLYVAMIAVVAYDRRLAVLVGVASMMLTALALDLREGAFIAGLVGVMLAAWRLADIRSRNDVVRGGLYTTAGVALGVVLVGLVERPVSWPVLLELLADGLIAGAGAFLASAMLLVTLPTIERVFDVTTGMTLAELRDPQHPLLRQLQQRAPGTYNHALNVATIAEAAADAIGADSLHAYVGAVYHDIGKMNKPAYFVENQTPGLNKHSNLSPAMSLLVIVGHVKDGVELAREYHLPRSLHHYIEAHHGTTLVEYFYDRAKRQADADENVDRPEEFEYRYPGPKPRTREAAILMLADTSESAARAMDSPTSARIEALVLDLSRKRLLDGQFDQCELTLRELTTIENTIIRSLTSIYHGRIAYPKGDRADRHDEEQTAEAPGAVAAG